MNPTSLATAPRVFTRRAFISTAALLAGGCSPDPVPRLRIGTFTFPGYEPFFLARSLGALDEKRVQLLEFPTVAEALLAFKNRAIDGLTVTLDDVLRLAQAGHEPRIVLMLDYSDGADVIVTKQTIADIEALRGQRVGVETNSVGTFVLARALETKGMKIDDVRSISLRADRIEGAFLRGELEAVVTYEPYRSRLIARGGREIFDSRALNGEIADVLVFRREGIEAQRANIALAVKGWRSALEYIRTQPNDALARMAPREGLSAEQFGKAIQLIHLYTSDENRAMLSPGDSALAEKLRKIAAFLEEQKFLPPGVDVSVLRDGSFSL